MFQALGRAVSDHPLVCVGLWVAVAVTLALTAPAPEAVADREPRSLLPPDQPYNQALELADRAFPQIAARTRTILVYERTSGLTEQDLAHLASVAQRLQRRGGGDWHVLSPTTHPYLQSRLLSADGRAAMIIVGYQTNYLTRRSVAIADAAESIAREGKPGGLTMEVTGEGGLGRDVTQATAQAYDRTTFVTIVAVLTILAFVYRAPLAALVPLASIGLSVFIALNVLNRLAVAGWDVSDLERTFAIVLLFGSGTDFAMLWMARYWEQWSNRNDTDAATAALAGTEGEAFAPERRLAAAVATATTGPAVVASAATTIAGLCMLLLADLSPTHTAGKTLGIALAISMVAALTLTPSVARLMRGWLFWPRRASIATYAGGVWPWVASRVVRHPRAVVIVAMALLAWPAWRATRITYRYDAFGVVSDDSSAARGQAIAEAHFTAAELFSWTILVRLPDGADTTSPPAELAAGLGDRIRQVKGIHDVWSIDSPLGRGAAGTVTRVLRPGAAADYYVSSQPPCIRVEVMQPAAPLSLEAMALSDRVMEVARRWARERIGQGAKVHATGLTPYISNVRAVSNADQQRIMVCVGLVIAAVVFVWIRRPFLTVCMVAATVGLYFATLTAADFLFVTLLGESPLDWKVKLFLFVIMMAVGQDYNIFLVARILQERQAAEPALATHRAIIRSGRVISSCGLIMAATLGSIAATGLPFYQQLGFAFAFGILLDTFVVRPAVIPACYLLGETWRSGRLDRSL